MKQIAWLNTVPRDKEKKLSNKADPQKAMTRQQKLHSKGSQPDLPPLGESRYLVNYLFEAGPTSATGMGKAPLSWQELHAWQSMVGIELQSWEVRGLRRLSCDFLAASEEAEDPDCPAPYTNRLLIEKRIEVANAVRNIFGSRKAH